MNLAGAIVCLTFYVHRVSAEDIPNEKLCYILDAILGLYALTLTVMYIRLRMTYSGPKKSGAAKPGEGIYQGLSPHAPDTYESIQVKKVKA
ncbi:high affinity immunoglobulin epsilon receptor subunit gamma-like [Engraulis encrasicolus]|uniref:high affinity immunoglobulin epsilon receptor subunit gamma-like n=1 Tax=Engraulis encrasicolus TaxID=184585 RepID=UPI002FD6A5CD